MMPRSGSRQSVLEERLQRQSVRKIGLQPPYTGTVAERPETAISVTGRQGTSLHVSNCSTPKLEVPAQTSSDQWRSDFHRRHLGPMTVGLGLDIGP